MAEMTNLEFFIEILYNYKLYNCNLVKLYKYNL